MMPPADPSDSVKPLWTPTPTRTSGSVAGLADSTRLVFISYAREDDHWLRWFQTMLTPLGDADVAVWSDQLIDVGTKWRPELEAAIQRADAALVLVSPALLKSEFVRTEELPALMARDIPIAFAHVVPSMAARIPGLNEIQWINDIHNPVAASPTPEAEIVGICNRLIDHVLPKREPTDAGVGAYDDVVISARRHAPRLDAGGDAGRLVDVPPPPPEEVMRAELDPVIDALLAEGEGLVGITGHSVGLHGQGGIGKTVLAAATARHPRLRHHFPDGIFWVTAGQDADVVALQLDLLSRLGAELPPIRSAAACTERLRLELEHRRCLVVVDDVWSSRVSTAFSVAGTGGRVLYTTRNVRVLEAVHAEIQEIGHLSDEAALTLLSRLTETAVADLPPEAREIVRATSGVALAIALVGAAVGRGGRSWSDIATEIARGSDSFLDHPYADVFKAMQVALGGLDEHLAAAYRTLAVYPEDVRVPVPAIARLWRHVAVAESDADVYELLGELDRRELLVVDDGMVTFHDLQREFLLLQAPSIALQHEDLLACYSAMLPADDRRWCRLDPDEPYIWDHLFHHLVESCDKEGVLSTATDLGYILMRCFRDGPHAAEADLRTAARHHSEEPTVRWLLETLARWGHRLTASESVNDLAGAIALRLQSAPRGLQADAMRPFIDGPVLCPVTGMADAPLALRRVLEEHEGWVWAVAFAPDGQTIATAGDEGVVRLWDVESGKVVWAVDGHEGSVWALAFSPGGRTLVSAGEDNTVRGWDAQSHAPIFATEIVRPSALSFTPDGLTLSVADRSGTVSLIDPVTGGVRRRLRAHDKPIKALAHSPDGRFFASGGADRAVVLWDTRSDAVTARWEEHTDWVEGLAFSADGRMLASAGYNRTIRLWDPAAAAPIDALFETGAHSVSTVAFAPDGSALASARDDGTISLYRIGKSSWTGMRAASLGTKLFLDHSDGICAMAFSPDGKILATAGKDGTVRFADPHAYDSFSRDPAGGFRARAIRWTPGGTFLIGLDGNDIVLWDSRLAAPAGESVHTLWGHDAAVVARTISADDRWLLSADEQGAVRLWNLEDLTDRRRRHRMEGSLSKLAFLGTSLRYLTATASGMIEIWDVSGEEPLTRFHTAHQIEALVTSPDGSLFAARDDYRAIHLWEIATGRRILSLETPGRLVTDLRFNRAGTHLLGAIDGTVHVWEIPSGRLQHRLVGHSSLLISVEFVTEDKLLTTSTDLKTTLWDLGTGSGTTIAHAESPSSAAIYQDRYVLLDDATTLRLIDLHTHEQVFAYQLGFAVASLKISGQNVAIQTLDDEVIIAKLM